VSSEGGYATTGEAVEGASNLYTEVCAGKEDEVLLNVKERGINAGIIPIGGRWCMWLCHKGTAIRVEKKPRVCLITKGIGIL